MRDRQQQHCGNTIDSRKEALFLLDELDATLTRLSEELSRMLYADTTIDHELLFRMNQAIDTRYQVLTDLHPPAERTPLS